MVEVFQGKSVRKLEYGCRDMCSESHSYTVQHVWARGALMTRTKNNRAASPCSNKVINWVESWFTFAKHWRRIDTREKRHRLWQPAPNWFNTTTQRITRPVFDSVCVCHCVCVYVCTIFNPDRMNTVWLTPTSCQLSVNVRHRTVKGKGRMSFSYVFTV